MRGSSPAAGTDAGAGVTAIAGAGTGTAAVAGAGGGTGVTAAAVAGAGGAAGTEETRATGVSTSAAGLTAGDQIGMPSAAGVRLPPTQMLTSLIGNINLCRRRSDEDGIAAG